MYSRSSGPGERDILRLVSVGSIELAASKAFMIESIVIGPGPPAAGCGGCLDADADTDEFDEPST